MCKHVAAVLYGVGARLDEKPELLFLLRHVDHQELVSQADSITALTETTTGTALPILSVDDVGTVFGIEMETGAPVKTARAAPTPRTAGRKTVKRKPARVKKKPARVVRGKPKKKKPPQGKKSPSAFLRVGRPVPPS
jgi:uncharacterized Zn finger protein